MRKRMIVFGMFLFGFALAQPAVAVERTVLMELFTNAY